MINIIYSEFLKLKKSYIIPITLVGAIFVPICMCIILLIDYKEISEYLISESLRMQLTEQFAQNINLFQIQIINILIISLISSYIFSREFIDKTANILYSYPVCRMKIFLSKIVVITILTFMFYMLNFIITILGVFIIIGKFGVATIFYTQLKVSLLSMILQIIIIPIPIFIGSMSKNIIFPIVYAVAGAISSMILMIFGVYMQLSPLMLPAVPFYYFYGKNPIDYIAVTISGVSVFILFMSLNIYYLLKADID